MYSTKNKTMYRPLMCNVNFLQASCKSYLVEFHMSQWRDMKLKGEVNVENSF